MKKTIRYFNIGAVALSFILCFVTFLNFGFGIASCLLSLLSLILATVTIKEKDKLSVYLRNASIAVFFLSATLLTISLLKINIPSFFDKTINGNPQIYNYYSVFGLILFVLGVVLFIADKLPMATSAILVCAAMVVFGIADFKTAFGQFASSTVIMLVAVLAFGEAAKQTGVSKKIGLLYQKIAKGNERIIIVITFVICFILSMWLTNVTVLAIIIPVLFSLKTEDNKINPLNLIIPATMAVNCGGIATLVGSSQQMTAQGLLEEYGYVGFKVFDLTPFGCILGVALLLYCLFIGYPLGKRIWGDREANEETMNQKIRQKSEDIEFKLDKSIILGVIFALTVFMYIYQKIPFTGIKVAPVITSICAAIATIVTGCIEQKKIVTKINWDIIGRLGACLGLASVLSACGGIKIISHCIGNIAGANFNPLALFILICLIAQVTSLFVSNSTAISVSLIVVISIADRYGLNVPAYAMGIVLASSMGASCPLSGSTWGISMAGGYRFSDYFKYGALADLIALVCIICFVPLLMGLTI